MPKKSGGSGKIQGTYCKGLTSIVTDSSTMFKAIQWNWCVLFDVESLRQALMEWQGRCPPRHALYFSCIQCHELLYMTVYDVACFNSEV